MIIYAYCTKNYLGYKFIEESNFSPFEFSYENFQFKGIYCNNVISINLSDFNRKFKHIYFPFLSFKKLTEQQIEKLMNNIKVVEYNEH